MNATSEGVSGPSMPFSPGTLVAGKYRIERVLGQGGMGYVVLARHVQLDQPVALKFMHAWLATGSPEGAARFLGEARAAARIQSDHVARVSDTGTLEDGSPYMVMEYLEGQDLEAMLQERRHLPVSLAIAYAIQASQGLGEAHAAGIIHRDLKPSNLFLARQTDGSIRVKLLDFGISKMVAGANGVTEFGEANWVHGSPLYMAPERMRSPADADQRADIWALGVVLYEMLAASPPFVGDTVDEICAGVFDRSPPSLRAIRADVPAVLEAAVMQCLEKDPRRRFQTVTALARALAPFGTPDARATAARIDRIMHGRGARIERLRREPTPVATAVPERPLTRTSFSRAVDRLADVMRPTGIEGQAVADASDDAAEVTQTTAAFSRVIRRSALKRARSRLLVVAAAGLLVAGAAVLGAPSPKTSTPLVQPRMNAPPTTPPRAASLPTPDAVPAPNTTQTAEVTAASSAPATSSPETAPRRRKSKPGAAAASNAAPIGTTGFGGRE
jgi:serine/threonine protein kinase